MIRYFKMKYEQFLVRLLDTLIKIISDSEWDLEKLGDKIDELEYKNDQLELELLNKNERILELEENLYFYESDNEDEESA